MITLDLHMHSHYSADGEKTPMELITMAKSLGLKTIALSDHNTPKGIHEMLELGKQQDIEVIPAIEFDTLFNDLEVHVLGYNMDYTQPYFQTIQSQLAQGKHDAIAKRLQRLNEYYHMEVTMEEVIATYGTNQLWASIIKYVLEDPRYMHIKEFDDYRTGGKRSDPQPVNFYWDLCSPGTPCYIRVEYPTLEESVKQIHAHGGVAIIAHPWRNFYKKDALLHTAIHQGIDGLEAYSNYHDKQQTIYYENFCKENSIVMTCGSDYHGKFKPSIAMGEFGYEKEDSEQLRLNFLEYLKKMRE